VDQIQNVVDQTEAMQKVAPHGFRIHYDFNANSDLEAVYPVLKELERFSVAGRIEDPINPQDRDGYRSLREKCKLAILVHHAPLDFMTDHLCDGLMTGHASIGIAAKVAAIAESTNTPIMLQQAGGIINQACLAHEAAVFKMATLDHVNLCHLWNDDVTEETMPIVAGSIQVPKGPGLGVTLDREKLARYEARPRSELGLYLVRIRYDGGLTIFARHDPHQPGAHDDLRFLHRLLGPDVPGPVPGYGNPVVSDFVDKETLPSFDEIWIQTEFGPVIRHSG
jgi:hypothetical protein